MSSALVGGTDTIVARATPAGRSALGVIRVSGPEVVRLAAGLCPEVEFERAWRAQLTEVRDHSGRPLDRGLAIPYRAPRSYTGEDLLELIVHGSPALLGEVMRAWLEAGCRAAAPGEFTRRAVANGKMDLIQAEGLRDLIQADTARQLQAARLQMAGVLSAELRGLRDDLLGALAEAEGALDFAGQGVELDPEDFDRLVASCRGRIAALLRTAAAGRHLREGVRVAIVGPVNAGKSTLFNQLVGAERAIVSARPGTTRDLIEAELDVEGVRVVLVDTAGLREEADVVESEGVRRARQAGEEADALLVVHPADGGDWVGRFAAGREWLGVLNRCDLAPDAGVPPEGQWVRTTASSGEGVERVEKALREMVRRGMGSGESGIAIGERHRLGLEAAAQELEEVDVDELELAAEGLRWAASSLAEVIGEVAAEDVLDRVFETFCLGK